MWPDILDINIHYPYMNFEWEIISSMFAIAPDNQNLGGKIWPLNQNKKNWVLKKLSSEGATFFSTQNIWVSLFYNNFYCISNRTRTNLDFHCSQARSGHRWWFRQKAWHVSWFNYFPASSNFCRMLLTFANSSDPDQDQQNPGPTELIWIQPVWLSDNVPERTFWKS